MRALAITITLVALAGCKAPNPAFCDEMTMCADGFVCDVNQCVPDPTRPDADITECTENLQCPSEEPVCGQDGRCALCTGEPDCAGRTEAPHCLDGACVACLASTDCAADTPYCDPASNTCRPCALDEECGELCDLDTGRCIAEGNIIYVNAAVSASGAACDKSEPCKTISEGLAIASDTRSRLKITAGTYGENLLLTRDVTLVGPGAVIVASLATGEPGIDVQGEITANLRGLTVRNAAGGALGDGIRCRSAVGRARLVGRQLRLEGNSGQGVDAQSCDVILQRSLILRNAGGGISVSSSEFNLVNNLIVANGTSAGAGSTFGGALFFEPLTGVFEFNTVAGNAAQTGASPGVSCLVSTVPTTRNSIVWGNGTGEQVSGSCIWTFSVIGPVGVTNATNKNEDPLFVEVAADDYHIGQGSPAINSASEDATLKDDFDGESRPAGARRDIGADERP
jgi:hypothetical protein